MFLAAACFDLGGSLVPLAGTSCTQRGAATLEAGRRARSTGWLPLYDGYNFANTHYPEEQ
eukprot:4412649-Amphidinium_carterae.1